MVSESAGTTQPAETDHHRLATADTTGGMTPARGLKFEALREGFYHDDRLMFFVAVHRVCTFVTFLSATAAFGGYAWFAMIAVVAAGLDLVMKFPERIRDHADLKRRAFEICEKGALPGADISALERELAGGHASEPSIMHAVNALATNRAAASIGRIKQNHIPLRPHESALRHVWPFANANFAARYLPS